MKTWLRGSVLRLPVLRMSVLGLLASLSLVACGEGTSESPASLGTAALTSTWGLSTPALGHVELFAGLLVGGDTKTGAITAVDTVTHKLAWVIPQKVEVISGTNFAHDDQYLYVNTIQYPAPASDKSLLVVSATGQILNRVSVPERANAQTDGGPQVVGNRLYLTANTQLLAFDRTTIATGTPLPILNITFPGLPTVVAMAFDSAGNPYVSTRDSHIYALEQSGKIRWSVDISRNLPINLTSADAIAISGDTLVATSGGGLLEAFDIVTGSPRWDGKDGRWPSFNNCTYFQSGFANYLKIGDGTIFVSPDGGTCVLAFSLESGAPLWVFDAPNTLTFGSDPLYLNGVLYATNTRLWAIDAKTGRALGVGKYVKLTQLTANVQYSPARDELYVWGDEIAAYRPVR